MQLPRLAVVKEGETLQRRSCLGADFCTECPFHKVRCEGCTSRHREQEYGRFQTCYGECHSCAGFKVDVTGVCCRSPLRTTYFTALTKGASDWNKPKFTYTKRPLLSFKQRAVFYISSGGVNTIAPGDKRLVDSDHEVVAVNLTRVWGSNGFYSRDLKDYLHLSASTKLVLMCMTLDDLLERAFAKEMYTDITAIQRVGIDYWMPLSFSAYPAEAHTHQYYQTLRTLLVTERMQAWWTTGDHRLPGLRTDDLILESATAIPQLVFNTQFVAGGDDLFKYHMLLFRHYHQIMPSRVAFWFVGATTPTFIHNTRLQCGKRDLYFLSAKPLYLASKGQALTMSGAVPSDLPKHELLQQNCAAFAKMVATYG